MRAPDLDLAFDPQAVVPLPLVPPSAAGPVAAAPLQPHRHSACPFPVAAQWQCVYRARRRPRAGEFVDAPSRSLS